jgi:hypothetical protein
VSRDVVMRLVGSVLVPIRPQHALRSDSGGVHGERIPLHPFEVGRVAHPLKGRVSVVMRPCYISWYSGSWANLAELNIAGSW